MTVSIFTKNETKILKQLFIDMKNFRYEFRYKIFENVEFILEQIRIVQYNFFIIPRGNDHDFREFYTTVGICEQLLRLLQLYSPQSAAQDDKYIKEILNNLSMFIGYCDFHSILIELLQYQIDLIKLLAPERLDNIFPFNSNKPGE